MLLSSTSAADDPKRAEWSSTRVSIATNKDPDDSWQLYYWETDTVIPFGSSLCWIDCCRGILFYDVFEPIPAVSFVRFPLDKFPSTNNRSRASSWLYRGVSAIDAGRALKFVDVARHDGIGCGPLKPGAGFTITCHTLVSGSTVWNTDCVATSAELWAANFPDYLPRDILVYPQVNIERPYVVNFLLSEFKYPTKKIWVVAINTETKTVESVSQHVNWKKGLQNEDDDLTRERFISPKSFLPCEFSKLLNFSR